MMKNPALRENRQLIKQMDAGNYGGIAGDLLAPIEQQGQANLEGQERSNAMGGNALMSGYQPALMTAANNLAANQTQQNEGMQIASAIPQIFTGASNTVLSGTEALDSLKDQALNQALQGTIASTVSKANPSGFSDLASSLGLLQSLGQSSMGMASAAGAM
jgi:hypothetical protein